VYKRQVILRIPVGWPDSGGWPDDSPGGGKSSKIPLSTSIELSVRLYRGEVGGKESGSPTVRESSSSIAKATEEFHQRRAKQNAMRGKRSRQSLPSQPRTPFLGKTHKRSRDQSIRKENIHFRNLFKTTKPSLISSTREAFNVHPGTNLSLTPK
jgi:hypothetical protein